MHFVRVQAVHPLSGTDTAIASKKFNFILLDQISICFQYIYIDIAFSRWNIVTEICEQVYKFQRFASWSGDGSFLFKIHKLCFICIHIKANASSYLLSAMQQYLQEVIDHLHSMSVIVFEGYCLVLVFFSLKTFSFFQSIDVFCT